MLELGGCAGLLVVVVLAAPAAPTPAAADGAVAGPRSIAVLPLSAKAQVDVKQTSVLDDLLLSALQDLARGIRVLGQSDVDRLLGFERLKDATGCNDVSCAVEIAGALGVDSLVYGGLGRLGRKFVLSLTWISQGEGRVLGRVSEVVESEEQLIDAVGVAVPKLLRLTPAVAPAAAPVTAAPAPRVLSPVRSLPPISAPVSERSRAGNLALNAAGQGFPSPLESDPGWGGGARPWDLVDGRRTYPGEWARGLAFVGGTCGTRRAVIDFGERRRFNRVVVWHHGRDQVPSRCSVQVWDGGAWSEVFKSEHATDLLAFDPPTPREWWESWSVPMDLQLPATAGSKVRLTVDSCGTPHGWLYELEVYDDSVGAQARLDPTRLASWLPGDGTWYERDGAIFGAGGHLVFGEELGDYHFAATAELVSGPDTLVGFLSRAGLPGQKDQGYAANIVFGTGKLNVFRARDGAWFVANPAWQTWTVVEDVKARLNRVVWEAVGARHEITLNGKRLYEFVDGATARGRPGFWVESPSTVVKLTELEVQPL